MNLSVLITTSGTGSRLGELTDFTNKSLIRIGDKPALSHIVEYYPEETNYVITLGHFGEYVKHFLLVAYPKRNFVFIKVDKFQGPGSSLGHSMLQAKAELQCPFIFHASDTILPHTASIPNLDNNWCGGSPKTESSSYRTLNTKDNKVIKINDQGEISFDYCYIGLCGIKDYDLFWNELEKIPNTNQLSDVHVINKMLETVEFNCEKIKGWLDIGNVTELNHTRNEFKTAVEILDKKNESIYLFKDHVIKFFADPQVNKNRVKRAEMLKGLVPELISSSKNFYQYKKRNGSLFSKSVNPSSFKRFLQWAQSNLWKERQLDNFKQVCFDFYVRKTSARIDLYLNEQKDSAQAINGETIPPAKELLSQIDEDWLCSGIPSQFHGDFILDNVLETKDGFCLLDWRQDFGGNLKVGDLYYDLAKLNHNLTINHGIVERNLFDSSASNCSILCSSTLMECKELLHKFIKDNNYDLHKVEILTSIIWLNMAALHEYPFNDFLFDFGKYNLHKTLNK